LVEAGHVVHYLCREQFREAIEDTGAKFHSDIDHEPEMFEGREADLFGALGSLRREHGLEEESFMEARFKLKAPMLELALPGVIRWLRELCPHAVLYCPMLTEEAGQAAHFLGIPSVALLTTAGPGSIPAGLTSFLAQLKMSQETIRLAVETFEPSRAATDRINSKYGLGRDYAAGLEVLGKLDALGKSAVTLVTTCEVLQDPMPSELADAYAHEGVKFEAVGPLLDQQGAKRAVGGATAAAESGQQDGGDAEVLHQVKAARAAGRAVVLVSMGTVITGDSKEMGWESGSMGLDGKMRGLTGRELCRAVWGGAFDALGADSAEEGPLLVIALGPQPKALGDLIPPANALCLPVLPQVDVLRLGVAAFLTHGGQNSFTEGLANSVPLVVCPCVGDQPVNARKAVDIGAGLQVPRPDCELGAEAAVAAQYRRDIAMALNRVVAEGEFREAAANCAAQLQNAGGVPRAVELVLAVAAKTSAKAGDV
jgi:hypothetical protein